MRILVVEPVAMLRSMIERALEGEGHLVHAVATFDEALARAPGGGERLVLLNAPDRPGPGAETCAALRRAAGRDLRVVLVVADPQEGMIASLAEGGPDGYLVRPIEPGKLPAWIAANEADLFAPTQRYLSAAPPRPRPAPGGEEAVSRAEVVTPSRFHRALFEDVLRVAGLEVRSHDPADAAGAELGEGPAVLFLEAEGPELDAWLARARAPGVAEGTRVVLVATGDTESLAIRAGQLGAARALLVPVSPLELGQWIGDHSRELFGRVLPAPAPEDLPDVASELEVMQEVLRLLERGTPDERKFACFLLGRTRNEGALDPILEVLEDPDTGVRAEAVGALGMIPSRQALGVLLGVMGESQGWVQRRAFEAIGNARDAAAIPPLLAYLDTGEDGVTISALRALARIGDPSVLPRIEPLASHASPSVRANATWALRELQGFNS